MTLLAIALAGVSHYHNRYFRPVLKITRRPFVRVSSTAIIDGEIRFAVLNHINGSPIETYLIQEDEDGPQLAFYVHDMAFYGPKVRGSRVFNPDEQSRIPKGLHERFARLCEIAGIADAEQIPIGEKRIVYIPDRFPMLTRADLKRMLDASDTGHAESVESQRDEEFVTE